MPTSQGLTPPPPPASLDPGWFFRSLSMPVGVTAQKVLEADLNRLGVYLTANAPTQGAVGAVTAPATTTSVCKIAAMPAGLYDVTTTICFVGATAPIVTTDTTNWRLVIGNAAGGTGQTVALLSAPSAVNQPQSRNIRVSVPGGLDLFLASVATPTAGVIYQGDLAAIPLTPVFVGFDSLVTSALGFTGWPVGQIAQYFPCNQELWAIAPVSGQAGSLPALLSVMEVRKRGAAGGSTIPYQGD